MVQPMRLNQALQIAAARDYSEWPTLVHHPIVHDGVERTIGRDAGRRPGHHAPSALGSDPEHGDGDPGEPHGEQVVGLEHAFPLGMVRPVQHPQGPMHHPAMGGPGHAFHGDHGDHEAEDIDDDHGRSLSQARVPRYTYPSPPWSLQASKGAPRRTSGVSMSFRR